MSTPDHQLGDAVRNHRTARGWSQEKLARAVDVGTLAVGKWERGQAVPTFENRRRLAEVFEVEPAVFGLGDPAHGASPADFSEVLEAIDKVYVRVADVPQLQARVDMLTEDLRAIREHLGIARTKETA